LALNYVGFGLKSSWHIYDLFISRWIGEAETMVRCSLSASDIQGFESFIQ